MVLVFTNGSQLQNPETNATAYTYTIQHRERIILEHSHPISKAIIFKVELTAISTGVRRALQLPYILCVVAYGDSTSALHSALDPSPHPAQSQSLLLIQALKDWLSHDTSRTITLKWCPSHSNIWQNGCTDYLTKHQTVVHDLAPIITISYAKMQVIKDVMNTWVQ